MVSELVQEFEEITEQARARAGAPQGPQDLDRQIETLRSSMLDDVKNTVADALAPQQAAIEELQAVCRAQAAAMRALLGTQEQQVRTVNSTSGLVVSAPQEVSVPHSVTVAAPVVAEHTVAGATVDCGPSSRVLVPQGKFLSAKDMLNALEAFSGHSDRKSTVLDPDTFPQFVSWFDRSAWQLTSSGVDRGLHARILQQKLSGAMLTVYMNRCQASGWSSDCSVAELRTRLCSLFSDSEAKYTRRVIDFKINPHRFAQDLSTWRSFLAYSSFASSCDRNEFLYGLVRDKMNAAVQDCLVRAVCEHQCSLDRDAPFNEFMDQAMLIAHRIQMVPSEEGPAAKRQKVGSSGPKEPSGKGGSKASTAAASGVAPSGWAAAKGWPEGRLLTALGRCTKCAFFPAKSGGLAGHTCDASQLSARMGSIRKALQKGSNPNAVFDKSFTVARMRELDAAAASK